MGEGRRQGGDRTEPQRRLTVPEAAAELGTTSEGVCSRIKRGTLRTVREGGRVFVILEGAPSGDRAGDRAELVDELRDRVTFLERELERRADEAAELRRIIAALTQRIPEIEAPRETPRAPRDSPESGPEDDRTAKGSPGQEVPSTEGPPRDGESATPRNTIFTSLVPLPLGYIRRRNGSIYNDGGSSSLLSLRGMYTNAAMQLFGITLIAAAAVFDLMNSPAVVLGGVNAIWTLRSIVTVAFGVYAGLKLQVVVSFLRPGLHSLHWAGLHTAGFLTGAAVAVIVILVPRLVDLPCLGDCAPFYMPSLTTEYIVNMIVTYVFGTWLLFISGVLLGNVIQVKAEQERWGIPGEAPSGGGQRRAAILALVGVIGAALLQSVGQIIAALVGNP